MSKNADNRRAPGEGTLRERKDRNKWEAAVVTGYQTNGHPKRLRKLFDTKTEARAWLLTHLKAKQDGDLMASSDTTLAQFVTDWLEIKRATRAPRTLNSYEYVLNRCVIPYLGNHTLYELKPMHVQRLVNTLRQKTTASLVSQAHDYLKMVLTEAVRLELVTRNAATAVKVPKPRRRELTRWSAEEAAKVLEFVYRTDHPLRHYLHIALTTGMRREELLGLRWTDVKLEAGELYVVQCVTYVNGKALFGQPKTPTSQRVIYLDAETVNAFRRQRSHVEFVREAFKHRWQEHDLVFPSTIGTPYPESTIGKAFRKLCQDVEVTPIRLYDLRSTWASNALEAGVDIKVVSERLGHRDVRFTLQVYVRTIEAQHRKAALGTDALYGSNPRPSEKIIDVKAKPAKPMRKSRAPKALPEKASATNLPPRAKKRKSPK
jgi:integrase